jgi:hypothetical protein
MTRLGSMHIGERDVRMNPWRSLGGWGTSCGLEARENLGWRKGGYGSMVLHDLAVACNAAI